MNPKLVVIDDRGYRVAWQFDDDIGGILCDDPTEGRDPAPTQTGNEEEDRDAFEHWIACKAVRESPGFVQGSGFESLAQARVACRAAIQALKYDRPMPDWANKALAAGWKPPKGWKP